MKYHQFLKAIDSAGRCPVAPKTFAALTASFTEYKS
jgi:hypothetical protein